MPAKVVRKDGTNNPQARLPVSSVRLDSTKRSQPKLTVCLVSQASTKMRRMRPHASFVPPTDLRIKQGKNFAKIARQEEQR